MWKESLKPRLNKNIIGKARFVDRGLVAGCWNSGVLFVADGEVFNYGFIGNWKWP
jgi:hypothetical protein